MLQSSYFSEHSVDLLFRQLISSDILKHRINPLSIQHGQHFAIHFPLEKSPPDNLRSANPIEQPPCDLGYGPSLELLPFHSIIVFLPIQSLCAQRQISHFLNDTHLVRIIHVDPVRMQQMSGSTHFVDGVPPRRLGPNGFGARRGGIRTPRRLDRAQRHLLPLHPALCTQWFIPKAVHRGNGAFAVIIAVIGAQRGFALKTASKQPLLRKAAMF